MQTRTGTERAHADTHTEVSFWCLALCLYMCLCIVLFHGVVFVVFCDGVVFVVVGIGCIVIAATAADVMITFDI